MSRTLWFAAGAASSLYAMVKARRAKEALTPDGLRDRLAGLTLGLHLVSDEVRSEMAVKENELRHRIGLGLDGRQAPALEAGGTLEMTREGNH